MQLPAAVLSQEANISPIYLPFISPVHPSVSPLYLPCISPVSPAAVLPQWTGIPLDRMLPTSPPYLPYLSPISPLSLPQWTGIPSDRMLRAEAEKRLQP